MFVDIEDVSSRLATQRYVASRQLATVVFLATRLNKPVLVEGPAGVGKTELAKALAQSLGRPLIRLQCYKGLDEAKALYEWEYGKQLLYTHVLREKINEVINPTQTLEEAARVLSAHEGVFFSEQFLVERPILQAIRSADATVLLIDEIDRADEEFEAFLLEFLGEYQVSIPELGTLQARSTPLIVLTSNRSRELSEPLKRRCLHLHLGYPTADVELEIIRLKVPEIAEALARELVKLIHSIRALDLRKAPSISETLDWAQTLVLLSAPRLTKELIEEIAQIGAVIGREFSHRLMAEVVAPMPEAKLREALDQLVSSELIFRRGTIPDATYAFKHVLVQDAAYQSLLKSRLRQLHGRIAEILEERFPDIAGTQPELLAYHCTEAGITGKAIDYWRSAGERAARRAAAPEAVQHFERALKLLDLEAEGRERDAAELRRQEAHGLLAPVLDEFTECVHTADLRNARALLESMA